MTKELTLICWTFLVYGVTLLLTQGHIFGWWRTLVRKVWLQMRQTFMLADYPVDECRMCQGVWVVLVICLTGQLDWFTGLAVYGASYFLATQER